MLQYVLYHSSLTGDHEYALEKLRRHAENGRIVDEYVEGPSGVEQRPELRKALETCKKSGAMLLILDMGVVGGNDKPIKEKGVQLKVLT